ncbi:MAG: hypothetical protein ACLUHE_07865 [Christensenellales bacterium]
MRRFSACAAASGGCRGGKRRSGRARVESVIDGVDFAAVEDVTLDVPGWPERRTLEQTVQALAGGEGFSADDVLTAALGIFMREVGALIHMMLSVMLPVVLASLLMHTLSPQSDSLSAMSRSACFGAGGADAGDRDDARRAFPRGRPS